MSHSQRAAKRETEGVTVLKGSLNGLIVGESRETIRTTSGLL